jgi:micrococcal nuclease
MLKRLLLLCIISTFLIPSNIIQGAESADNGQPGFLKEVTVHSVIDGDTIETTDGIKIRYLGIDTPELFEPLYEEAKERNIKLLKGKKIKVEVCKEEPRDKYGRLLAWVYADGELVNAIIIRDGYATLLIIAPCGLKKAKELKEGQLEAIKNGVGLWAGVKTISFSEADEYIGKYMKVRGKIVNIYDSGKAVFLNFSKKLKNGFYAVIFYNSLENFKTEGIIPKDYLGKEVIIIGKIKEYRGRPEIIVELPHQIVIEQ